MKKMSVRFLSLLLTVLLLLAMLPAPALAADSAEALPVEVEIERRPDGEGGYDAMVENTESLGGEASASNNAVLFAAASPDGTMYGQLTKRQQACYDVLKSISIDRIMASAQVQYKGVSYRRATVQVEGITGTTMAGTISGGIFTPSRAAVATEKGIYTDLCAAIVALRYDCPELLWLGTMRYGYKVTVSGSSAAKITDVMFDFHLSYGGLERSMQADMLAQAQAVAAQAAAAPDTYSKVKAIHDALAAANVYGDPDNELAHTAYSALISGDSYEPVCDGYSKAFKIVCDLLEIPCALASSATHMWNNVKMDDGEWYNVDLTWDDDYGDSVQYEYFLVGSQTVIDGEAFSRQETHIEENPYNVYLEEDKDNILNPVTLGFPAKNTTAYVYLGRDYEAPRFPDVRRSAWYYADVENAAQLGLFQGDDNGCFNPMKNISRAEFATVMANALGADLTGYSGSSFTDVSANQWYAPAIAWAKEAGVMKGNGNGTFRPNAPITREEMCVTISQALGETQGGTGFVFPDDASISSWAKNAVYECYALGLVKGDDKGYFSPRGNTLRCAAAAVFTRFASLE